jgi:3-oxoacyl-[acyl-carrier protein] reductase
LINAAGISLNQLLLSTKQEQIDDLIKLNLYAPIMLTRGLLKGMIRERQGSVVNVCSIVGPNIGNTGQSIYASTKAGLVGFTKSLSKEVGRKGVRVNAVCPGFINSDMTSDLAAELKRKYEDLIPLNRFGTSDEVADAIQFLVRNPYMNGASLVVDGGLSS